MSTSSGEDLAGANGAHFIFEGIDPSYKSEGAKFLEFPNRWFLGCRFGGCSCHFRNYLRENPPIFGRPEEWFPEDPEDIEATAAFYDLVSRLIAEGHQVDTVTVWTDDYPFDTIWTREISLAAVSREEFRFIDQYRFRFVR